MNTNMNMNIKEPHEKPKKTNRNSIIAATLNTNQIKVKETMKLHVIKNNDITISLLINTRTNKIHSPKHLVSIPNHR